MTNQREMQALLRRELKEYLATISDLTADERKELREWVAEGNSVYGNGYYMCDGNGDPMDYITAERTVTDMRNNPQDYNIKPFEDTPPEDLETDDDDLPF